MSSGTTTRLPPWFRVRLATGERYNRVRDLITANRLHTVCRSAGCPNRNECWNAGTATFMILGEVCTRACRFCGVPKGSPQPPDADEAVRVAGAVAALKLDYAVITSVTRDDLPDGGASLFARVIRSIRSTSPSCKVEVLVPDFQGSENALRTVIEAGPHILNHNLETVPSLYSRVRPQAVYGRSLELLDRARKMGATTKTGLMLGLGESVDEVVSVFKDLRLAGCGILTLGQYLRPGREHLPVEKFYHPDEFKALRESALSLGFGRVEAGPLVRSSYRAGQNADFSESGAPPA